MLSRGALSRTVTTSKLLPRSPQVHLQLELSSPGNLSSAPLFSRPTTAAPDSGVTPPLPGTPPLHHLQSSRPTAGLFSPAAPFARPYTTAAAPTSTLPRTPSSSRPNSSKISASRSAQIARHLSGSSSVSPSPSTTSNSTSNNSKMAYTTRKVAAPYTLEHRVYIEKDGIPVSPFHDIPLFANQEQTILNMVVEIPRWTNAKLEVSRRPAVHDTAMRTMFCHPADLGKPSHFGVFFCRDQVTDTSCCLRFPRRSSSTPSSRTSRRASSATSATASPTRATCGTTVPSPRYDQNLTTFRLESMNRKEYILTSLSL